ncbi:hypothetical protein E4U14_008178 [Claviceps sp. LM454 group G7]|nr:hypothetical protein E4U14_008178 [Claviceps sp. LM454 group G7]
MGSLVGLPLRSVILEGSSSANGDNGLDLALCESITRLEKWMTKYGTEDEELCPIAIEYGVLRISRAMLIPSSKGTLRPEATVELGDHFRNIQLPPR